MSFLSRRNNLKEKEIKENKSQEDTSARQVYLKKDLKVFLLDKTTVNAVDFSTGCIIGIENKQKTKIKDVLTGKIYTYEGYNNNYCIDNFSGESFLQVKTKLNRYERSFSFSTGVFIPFLVNGEQNHIYCQGCEYKSPIGVDSSVYFDAPSFVEFSKIEDDEVCPIGLIRNAVNEFNRDLKNQIADKISQQERDKKRAEKYGLEDEEMDF